MRLVDLMIDESSKEVVRTPRRHSPVSREFTFTKDMVRLEVASDCIREYRLDAWNSFKELSLPTVQEEAWRRINLRKFKPDTFKLAKIDVHATSLDIPKALLEPLGESREGGKVILSPSGVERFLGPELSSAGVVFSDLQTAESEYPEILEKVMGKAIGFDEDKFTALSAALAQFGILIYVPRGVEVKQPLRSLFWSSGGGHAFLSHILVYLEEGASVTYFHEASSPTITNEQTLHSGIVEIRVERGANLQFIELQNWSEQVWNFNRERIVVEQDGNVDWVVGAVGSHLTKNFSDLNLVGQRSSGRVAGFYFSGNQQHIDYDTQQNHLAAHTTSDLLYKGAIIGKSRSVWQGMIYVSHDSQKSDGYQMNQNLVLSPNARADAIPGLEIMADDVRCSHGATVGKIDPNQIFYFHSRGIPLDEARRLIIEGFFSPVLERIPFAGVRERLHEVIKGKMSFAIIDEETV